MAESPEKPVRVIGADAERVKREALGIADRRKHHTRPAAPMKRRAKESGTQQRVYRFRFYPTPAQAEQLEQTFGACRWVYNEGLAAIWRLGAAPCVGRFCGNLPRADRLAAVRRDVVVTGGVVDGPPAGTAASGRGIHPLFQGDDEASEAEEEAPLAGFGDVRPDRLPVGRGS